MRSGRECALTLSASWLWCSPRWQCRLCGLKFGRLGMNTIPTESNRRLSETSSRGGSAKFRRDPARIPSSNHLLNTCRQREGEWS